MPQKFLFIFFIILTGLSSFSQTNLLLPKDRAVYQRTNDNIGSIPIKIENANNFDQIEISLLDINNSSIFHRKVSIFSDKPLSTVIDTFIVANGGWYSLKVEYFSDQKVIKTERRERVGIGEIFLVAGQSNAEIEGPEATDERVIGAYYDQDTPGKPTFISLNANEYTKWLWPSPPGTSFLGVLGDSLVKKLNVPVLFFNAASGGSSSYDWWKSGVEKKLPYIKIEWAINRFIKDHGIRGVLWHQGEANSVVFGYHTDKETYRDQVKSIIERSRDFLGYEELSWIVAQVSWSKFEIIDSSDVNDRNTIELREVTKAGQVLLSETVPNVYLGPDTDKIEGYFNSENRYDGVHFTYSGMAKHAQMWNEVLNDYYFNNSKPYLKKLPQRLDYEGLAFYQNCDWQNINITSNSGLTNRFDLIAGAAQLENQDIRFLGKEDKIRLSISNEGNSLFLPLAENYFEFEVAPFAPDPINLLSSPYYLKNQPFFLMTSCTDGNAHWYHEKERVNFIASGDSIKVIAHRNKSFFISCYKNGCYSENTMKYELIEKKCIPSQTGMPLAKRKGSIGNTTKLNSTAQVALNAENSITLIPNSYQLPKLNFKATLNGCETTKKRKRN